MKLNQLSVAIKQVLNRPLFDEEKAIYEHNQLDFQKHVIKSARKFGRSAAYVLGVSHIEEVSRKIYSSMGVPGRLLVEDKIQELNIGVPSRYIDTGDINSEFENERTIDWPSLKSPRHYFGVDLAESPRSEDTGICSFVESITDKPLFSYQKALLSRFSLEPTIGLKNNARASLFLIYYRDTLTQWRSEKEKAIRLYMQLSNQSYGSTSLLAIADLLSVGLCAVEKKELTEANSSNMADLNLSLKFFIAANAHLELLENHPNLNNVPHTYLADEVMKGGYQA